MPTQRFLIAPYDKDSGQTSNVKPWIIPDTAFEKLTNAYVFRGRVRKRFGSRFIGDNQLLSRLRLNTGQFSITLTGGAGVGITSGIGNATGTVPGSFFQLGQRFVIGAETDTVTNPAAGAQPMTSTGPSVTHTYNIGTGAYNFVGAPINTQIYFFPNPISTDVSGNFTGILPNPPISVGTMFSVGSVLFTVNTLGAPATMLVANGSATTATINTTTGIFTLAAVKDSLGVLVISTAVYFYPSLPVMGLLSLETNNIDDEIAIAFDPSYAYQYAVGWQRLAGEVTSGAATWSGNNAQFFWGTTWTGTSAADKFFFATNFNENEANFMRFFNPSTALWDNFRPLVAAGVYMNAARIIVPFKNRLVCFNTWEGAGTPGLNYVNRARYSWVGDPTNAGAFRKDLNQGGAIDASTTEAIVTVEFIKDRLIVFFERSTWELAYTGNQAYPFTWQQINTELGAESTFSVVPFDRVALGVGNVGVHACNGANVERIDDKIPDEVFAIHNTDGGIYRVYGIRDYYTETVYWTFPSFDTSATQPYPNRVFVYNYKTSTWAFNDDSITAFGYIQPTSVGSGSVLWDSTTVLWDDPIPWGSGSVQLKFRQVAAGNQEGFTFICDSEATTNASALQITNITTTTTTQLNIIDHNLRVAEYIFIEGAQYNDASNGLNNIIFQVINVIDKDNVLIGPNATYTGTYIGGGLAARVSNIEILTKQYNFFAEEGRNAYISKIDFLVDTTAMGQIGVNFFVSTSRVPLLQDSAASGVLLGTGTLETFPYPSIPFESLTNRVWHPVYFQADGEVVQFQLTMNDAQMRDVEVRRQDFQLHAVLIHADKTSQRFQ